MVFVPIEHVGFAPDKADRFIEADDRRYGALDRGLLLFQNRVHAAINLFHIP